LSQARLEELGTVQAEDHSARAILPLALFRLSLLPHSLDKTTKNLVPVLLILAFKGYFTGKTTHYVSGLSPFFSDMARVEAVVFSKAKDSHVAQEQVYEDQVRNRIRKVISKSF